ncbi:hypothetical protein DYB36_008928, partial [Aphanomyces astaci]
MLLGLRGSKNMFEAMLGSLVRTPTRFFDTNPMGRLLNRCGDDVFQCGIEIPLALLSILLDTASALSKILTSVFVIQWMGLLLPPLVYGYYKLGAYFLAPLVSEAIDGAVTIRAFGDRPESIAINMKSATCFAMVAVNQWYSLRIQFVSNAMVLAILLGCVVGRSKMSPGLLAQVITYGQSHEEGFKDVVALEALWPTAGHIAFDRVGFQYKVDDPLVLQNVSFTIKGGEKVGVVGRTGVGKSSLTMALFRINEL